MTMKEVSQSGESRVMQQPQALKDLSAYYESAVGKSLLERIPPGEKVLFSGEGVDHYIACMAAAQCCRAGIDARSVTSRELIAWPDSLLAQFSCVCIISQSGSNSEITPLLNRFDAAKIVVLTNSPDSLFASRAGLILPLCAGLENCLGLKSQTNTLELVWLMSRKLSKRTDGSEAEQLKRLRQHMQIMLDGKSALFEQWQTCLGISERLFFTGCGYHALTAELAANMLMGVSTIPCAAVSLSSLLQNGNNLTKKGFTVIVFQETGSENDAALQLLQQHGGMVIRVEGGFPLLPGASFRPAVSIAAELSPMLDILSVQLLSISWRNSE
jgi:fructoselysine-6-P-deglycase FrlB-like protein